jgi:hypothetical protein
MENVVEKQIKEEKGFLFHRYKSLFLRRLTQILSSHFI